MNCKPTRRADACASPAPGAPVSRLCVNESRNTYSSLDPICNGQFAYYNSVEIKFLEYWSLEPKFCGLLCTVKDFPKYIFFSWLSFFKYCLFLLKPTLEVLGILLSQDNRNNWKPMESKINICIVKIKTSQNAKLTKYSLENPLTRSWKRM